MAVKTGRGALAAAALRAVLMGSAASVAMLASPAFAQTGEGTVTGVITSRTGAFLEGAEVLVPAAGLRAVTDRAGRFTLPAPAGAHDVVVRYQGQPDATRSITVAAGQATTLDVTVGAVVGQTVIVRASPIAESQAAALQVQRTSDSLVSVLSADAAGNFPDQNIAAAIGRLPGVGVQRDQGQTRYINLRGARINWTTLSFDGLSVVSPEGRATRFDNIPTAIASQTVVEKAVTPNMPGETVAGNVNIRTRTAFDYPGRKISGKAGLGYVELGGGEEADFAIVASDRFLDDKLGVLLQFSYYIRNMVTDNWETDPYLRPGGTLEGATAASGSPDRRPGSETRFWAREFEHKPYRLTRRNDSNTIRFDYRFNDDHQVFASSIYTRYRDDELRNNYIFRFDQATGTANLTGACPATPAPITGSAAYDICAGNAPNFGTVFGVNISSNFNVLESVEETRINTIGGEHRWSGWDVSWRLNYTEAEDGRDAAALPNFASPADAPSRPTVEYDFRNPDNNTVRLFRTNVTNNVRSRGAPVRQIHDFPFVFQNITKRIGGDLTQAWTGKIDFERELEMFGVPTDFKAGLLYTDRAKKSREISWTATAAQVAAAGLPAITYASVSLPNKSYQAKFELGYDFIYHSEDALTKLMNDLVARGVATRNNTTSAFWDVSEEITAGYAMGSFDLGWGTVIAGARIEQIENTGQAFVNFPAAAGRPAQTRLVTTNSEETLVYPSLHVNWDINDEMKARVGVTYSASRPDFSVLRPNFTFNDATRSVSGGNPDATPERQLGFDAYFEWYMRPSGFFSAGVYYKEVTDLLVNQVRTFNNDALNEPGFDRSTYEFSSTINAGDGYIAGFELYLQQNASELVEQLELPDWLGGFGFTGSLTVTESEFTLPRVSVDTPTRKQVIPGTSDYIYNVALSYEKYGLSARLAYQFRTAWVSGIGTYRLVNGRLVPDGNGDTFWDDDGEMDLSIRYQLTDNFEIYLDGNNLTDEAGRRYADQPQFPIEYEKFGRRWLIGARFNF
jgi:TonB-dependent receptor